MPTSEARIRANRENASRSTGPRTPEGKAISRRNGLKHGMAGAGVVVPESDAEAIEARRLAFEAEMAPKTAMGLALIVQIATLSVRVERSFRHESAATRHRMRHAIDAFDDERHDRAGALLDGIGADPRHALRKLRRMPEGVEAMIEAWEELRADLTRDPRPIWTAAHRERAENLAGRKVDHAHDSTINALSKRIWGEPGPQVVEDEDDEANDRAAEAGKAKARGELVAYIDAQVDALELHHETLDLDAIEEDRAEAPDRALFDPSKEATLSRRYESEALRNFHKALKEFRRVEAEAADAQAQAKAQATAAEAPPSPEPAPKAAGPLASSREIDEPTPEELIRTFSEAFDRLYPLDETHRTGGPGVRKAVSSSS